LTLNVSQGPIKLERDHRNNQTRRPKECASAKRESGLQLSVLFNTRSTMQATAKAETISDQDLFDQDV